jgi:nucleoid-associated protein YgaU
LPSGTTTETTTPSPAATTDRLPSEPEEGNLWQLDADADLALKEKDPEPTITNLTAVPSPATAEPRPAQPRLSPLSSPPPSSTPVRDISTIRPSISGGTPNTYTVQKGDLGYWMIAEKVYGPGMGKHWPRIAEANNVDTGKLRPGMVLKIPSLPSETARASTSAGGLTASRAEVEANYGKTISSNGRREYVVGPDDSTGFWGISQKVYGAGKYASLLQNANPGVDSTKLRAGMRLNVPPKPAESTTPTRAGASTSSTDTAGHGRITNVAGRKYYVVKSQDTLGGIAQSVYGSSRYYPVIEKANPEIDPLTIQPGDRLLIPPKPASPPPSSPVGSVPSGGTSPSGIPEPDFGG